IWNALMRTDMERSGKCKQLSSTLWLNTVHPVTHSQPIRMLDFIYPYYNRGDMCVCVRVCFCVCWCGCGVCVCGVMGGRQIKSMSNYELIWEKMLIKTTDPNPAWRSHSHTRSLSLSLSPCSPMLLTSPGLLSQVRVGARVLPVGLHKHHMGDVLN